MTELDLTQYRPMVITVDGTAASGKGTIVRGLLKRLDHYRTLDAGSMYRLFTHMCRFAKEGDISPERLKEDRSLLTRLMEHNSMDFTLDGRLLLNGAPIDSEYLRGPEIDDYVADYAAIPDVKTYIVEQQRDIVQRSDTGWVLDGRCMGTAVAPDAEVKFFVDAPVGIRATRRHEDYEKKGIFDKSVKDVRLKLEERDEEDYSADPYPLARPTGSHYINSEELSKEEVESHTWDIVQRALNRQRE